MPAGGVVSGQRLKLVLPTGAEVLAQVARAAAAGESGLVLRRTGGLTAGPVFAYGLEHADVRAVDYEALAMLNVSATQELARQVAALTQQNAALRTRAAALETAAAQTATDHADLQTLKQQLARLLGENPPAEAQARR